MTIAWISDCHLGNHNLHAGAYEAGLNQRCRLVLDVLARACWEASRHAEALVVCGDLFDTCRPSPQVIAATMNALSEFPGPKYLLAGNHDMASGALGDNALAPLGAGYGGVFVVDAPQVLTIAGVKVAMIPFQAGPAHEWFLHVLPRLEQAEVLCLHLGIRTDAEKKLPWFRDASDAIDIELLARLMNLHNIEAAFAGNWHTNQTWGGAEHCITQVGTLCPTGHDNPGLNGYGFIEFYPHRDPVEIPGPRFLDRIPAWPPPAGFSYFVQLKGKTAERPKLQAMIDQAVEERKVVAGVVRIEAAEQTDEVVRTSLTADFVDQALERYVGGLQSVDKADVLARAKRYLAAGRG